MSTNRITTIGVIYGGRSVEHDVSVVTAHQAMNAFDRNLYEVIPIYITRHGQWVTGEPLFELKNHDDEIISHSGITPVVLSPAVQHHGLILNPLAGRLSKSQIKRLDVVFPAIHGTHGEDGTLQGLLELADIPYVGCRTLASALANDKIMTKNILRQAGISVVPDVTFTRTEWLDNPQAILDAITNQLTWPVFVKPATTGSSIGIGRATDEASLRTAIDIAAHFDRRILAEAGITNHMEINCAIMGTDGKFETSVLEQPISWDEMLTFEEKYLRGSEGMKSAERIIPAPLTPAMTEKVQQMAIAAFKAIDGSGLSRIDFLVRPENDEIYLNEINTLPGSLAFYLWQESGITIDELVHKLVQLAREAHAEKRRNSYDYRTDLVNLAQTRGLKGAKATKTGQPSRRN